MHFESSVTSVSWIPSEAMAGLLRLPMDVGMGHYEPPPPERCRDADLDRLRDDDQLRFANRLQAWINVEEGEIVDAGYSGRSVVGSTTVRLGVGSVTFPGVGFPLIQDPPVIKDGLARFAQTAGGRTGAPMPRRTSRPPFVRVTAPAAWTTLGLEISADGSTNFEVVGASPFPRHWIYDGADDLAAKSGVIDFSEWAKVHDHGQSPWNDIEREALVADIETQLERKLSRDMMMSKPRIRRLGSGELLTEQGDPGDDLFLVLDGLLQVDVDGEVLAEIGPGAIIGERAILEGGQDVDSGDTDSRDRCRPRWGRREHG